MENELLTCIFYEGDPRPLRKPRFNRRYLRMWFTNVDTVIIY